MAYSEEDGLVTMALAVQPAVEGIHILFTVYPETDAMNPAGQVYWDAWNGGDPKMLLSTADGLSCLWSSPEGNAWCGSVSGNIWTTAAEFEFSSPAKDEIDWEVPEEAGDVAWQYTALQEDSEIGLPNVSALWGVNDTCVFAGSFEGPIHRWDGAIWTRLQAPLPEAEGMIEMHGLSERDIYAVGHSGRILHFDGVEWSVCGMPKDYPAGTVMTGIRALPDGKTIAVDIDGNVLLGNADRGFKIVLRAAPIDFRGVALIGGQVVLASSQGAFTLMGNKIEPLKLGFMANRVFESDRKLFFIESEQDPDPCLVEYTPGSKRLWARRTF